MQASRRIALVAGETSGDALAATLMQALRARLGQVEFIGLAGEQMRATGCEPLGSSEELAVMGLVEPLRHLPRLLALRKRLGASFLARGIDLFVGVDAPAFNLGLARKLRARGVPTVQFVSPQVWAWRRGRVRGIARAVDAVLCLFPFEPGAYAGQPVRAEFVGHPLADRIPLESQRDAARSALGIDVAAPVVALLPGSRAAEVRRLGPDFARAAAILQQQRGGVLELLAPMVSDVLAERFALQARAAGIRVRLLRGQADVALAAADAALVASGTATLQAMLHGVPMVVAYRLAPLTAFIVHELGLVKLRQFSLPNLLAGEALVPEFFQRAVQPEALADALEQQLSNRIGAMQLRARFREIHEQLRQGAAQRAATIIAELAGSRGGYANAR